MNVAKLQDEAARLEAEDERRLLCACMTDAAMALEATAAIPPDEVYWPQHRALFALIGERVVEGKAVDLAAISEAVWQRGPDRFGGSAYVADLADPDLFPSGLADLVQRIRTRALRRKLREVSVALEHVATRQPATLAGEALPDDPESAAAEVALHLSAIAQPAERVTYSLAEALDAAVQMRREQRESNRPLAVATRSRPLDELLDGGLRRGEFAVIAGRPGMGKTSFALGLAVDMAEEGARVGFISLEMSAEELADKVLSRASGMPLSRVRRGEADDTADGESWRVHLASGIEISIYTPHAGTPAGISAQTRRWKARGIDVVMLDYIQLVHHDRAERPDLAVGQTSKTCKALARQLKIPVVGLAQLNREVEKRAASRKNQPRERLAWWEDVALPQLADLRESGQIEQDADVVMFPVRAELYGVLDTFGEPDRASACVYVAKNRNGRTGVVPATWVGHTASYAREDIY